MGLCIAFLLDYYEEWPHDYLWRKILATTIAIICPLIIGFSRLYLGVHSIDQILSGWEIGLWGAFFSNYCLKSFIMKHVDNLLNQAFTKDDYKGFIFKSLLLLGISLSGMIFAYEYSILIFTPPEDWY